MTKCPAQSAVKAIRLRRFNTCSAETSSGRTAMPHGSVTDTIPATSAEVFCLLHDYDRRLEWDTLLQDARLDDNWTEAQHHAISTCTGCWFLGRIALQTEYVSFAPPHLAAVKMLNRPLFFATFAATIRHQDLTDGSSTIQYTYNFTARPLWLRWLLHPGMSYVFRYETRRRLRALRHWFENAADKMIRQAQRTPGTH